MTTETTTGRPVKYTALEWRNKHGEKFDAYQEGSLCYLKDDEDIGHFVTEKIQLLPGVKDTFTMITFKAFS